MAEQEGTGDDLIPGSDIDVEVEPILALKRRAEVAAIAAEEANRKANSESGYAFNAKGNAEEHARTIAQIKGAVEADANWLAATKQNAGAALEAIETARKTGDSESRATAELRVSAEASVAKTAELLKAIEAQRETVVKVAQDVVALAQRVADDASSSAQGKANIDVAWNAASATHTQISEWSAKAQADTATIAARDAESAAHLRSISVASAIANEVQARVTDYEAELARLKTAFGELHSQVEALLPGATSAGLASAFRSQKDRFKDPQRNWAIVFGIAIVGLSAMGVWGFATLPSPLTLGAVQLHLLSRIPLAVPVAWLALYAGRNYMLALRLQEDYAYKEAISTAFEGYRRQMTDVAVPAEERSPLIELCANVLRTLGQTPGRLYDGKHEDVTPLTPAKNLLASVTSRSTKESE